MKNIKYKTTGVCCKEMNIILTDDNIIEDIEFVGGCPGNTLGVRTLAIGEKAEIIAEKLKGIKCGFKSTSCPDQLSNALLSNL